MFASIRKTKLQMASLTGMIFKGLFLIWLLSASGNGDVHKCCNQDIPWIPHTTNCSDGNRIQLECNGGFYMLEPHEKFRTYEDENSSWLSYENEYGHYDFNISHDSYCITKMSSNINDEDIALICFPDEEEQLASTRPVWRDFLFGLCSVISSVFLALTLFVYLILPEMREIQDKAVMCVTGSFMVGFYLMGHQQLRFSSIEDDVTCLVIAFLMYYAYLCAFFWMNVMSLNIFRAVWFPNFRLRNDILFIIYCMIGWGLPLCFLAVSLTTHHVEGYHLKPGFGEGNCWFSGQVAVWVYFYGPIMILLSINLIYLGLTSWKLCCKWKDLDGCKIKVLRFKCCMYVKLALMMGFTWIFEVISFAFKETNHLYWILPDILNVMQGLFIFILFVVSRKRVRKLLAKRRPFNIPFPKSWAAYEDLENCEQVGPEEFELSHDDKS